MSLFEPVYQDNGDSLAIMDQVKDTRDSETGWLDNIAISQAMEQLNDRERYIIQLRFFKGRTQMEVAKEIGISQAQVSRLEKGALMHMKKQL